MASLNQPRAEQPGSWEIENMGAENAEGSQGGWKQGEPQDLPPPPFVRAEGPAAFGEGIGNVAAAAEQCGQ